METAAQPLCAEARAAGDFDVVVCGGGPAGVAAAVAAARSGARTLLLEVAGCLGGAGTGALVGVWLGSYTRDHREKVVAGIFDEIVARLAAAGAARPADQDVISASPHVGYGAIHGRTVPFDYEACKRVLETLVTEAGVELRLCTTFVVPQLAKARIKGVFLHGKSGFSYVRTRAVVDATGDADVAFRAGCPTRKGRAGDGLMTPGSLIFVVEDVDSKAVGRYCRETGDVRFRRIVERLRAADAWPFPFTIILVCETARAGTFFVNTLRQVGVDGTDEVSITAALVQGRRQAAVLLRILRDHVPGFAAARLTQTSPRLGIRETRRIRGEFVLRTSDLTTPTHFPDTIALTGFGWDLPDPQKPSSQPMHGVAFSLPYTEVPYRCLVPCGVTNLLVAGRCISVERDVLGPVRVQPCCFATGQAAGMAASMVAQHGTSAAEIDHVTLRGQLRKAGAIVECGAKTDTALVAEWVHRHRLETGQIPGPDEGQSGAA